MYFYGLASGTGSLWGNFAHIFLLRSVFCWDESPIKTTIETLSISKLKFPKITVCPPKNTYTNLNYDLMKSENITITKKTRQELIDYFYELNHDEAFFNVLMDLDLITNEKRYFDWYHGYTELALPDIMVASKSSKIIKSYKFKTSSASGNISTKYFGERFDGQKVQKELVTFIEFYFDDIPKDKNISFFFHLEREGIIQLRNGLDNFMINKYGVLPNDRKSLILRIPVNKNVTDVGNCKGLSDIFIFKIFRSKL